MQKSTYADLGYIIPVITGIFFVVCMIINGKQGKNNGKISDRYFLKVTPPGYFFAIWGIIYTTTIIALIWACVSQVWKLDTFIYFNIYCILNSIWILLWASGKRSYVCFDALILYSMLIVQFLLWRSSLIQDPDIYDINLKMYYFMRQTLAFQLGWLTAASCLNTMVFLVYGLGVNQDQMLNIFWIQIAILCMIFTYLGFINCDNNIAQVFDNFICYYLSAFWAISGAFISTNKNIKSGKKIVKQ